MTQWYQLYHYSQMRATWMLFIVTNDHILYPLWSHNLSIL